MRGYFEELPDRLRIHETDVGGFPEHLHPQAELLYLFAGETTMLVDGRPYRMRAGDLCLSFPGMLHGYQNSQDARALMLIFAPELWPDFTATLNHSRPESPLLAREQLPEDVAACMERLARECARGSDERVLRGYMQVVLARALPLLALTNRTAEVTDVTYAILQYLSRHFTEPVTLVDLARALGMSKSYVSHTFSQRIGTNFRTYVNTLRVDQACMLLRSTDRSITQILYECGFETQRTFNRVFVERYGATPSEYRQRHRDVSGGLARADD